MGYLGWLYKLNLHPRHQHCTDEAQAFYQFIVGLSQGGALSVCESIFSCPFRCPRGVGRCGLSPRGSALSCTFHYIMSDLGNPDVPRSLADASEDLYSPVSVSLSLSGEAGLLTNEDAHMEVNLSSALPSASSCDPGVVLSHPSAFDSSPSYLGSSPMNVSYAAAVTQDRPSFNGGSTATRPFVM